MTPHKINHLYRLHSFKYAYNFVEGSNDGYGSSKRCRFKYKACLSCQHLSQITSVDLCRGLCWTKFVLIDQVNMIVILLYGLYTLSCRSI